MIRKIGLTLCLSTALYSTSALSTTEYILAPNMSFHYTLQPNIPLSLTNYVFWDINAICTLTINDDKSGKLKAKAIYKNSSVAGSSVPKDGSLVIDVKDKQDLSITAEPGAQVELLNIGEYRIEADCRMA